MKIKSTELKKLINEAIKTETKALIREGYSQEQLEEIDFSKVGNFFKGAARGVKDIATDVNKNYFDNSDLNLESEINKLSKRREISSKKVAEAQGKLSELKSELSGINKSIREKTLQLNKIKKEKMGNSSFKKYSNQDRYTNEKKPVQSNTNSKQVSTSKSNKEPINLNRNDVTYEDPRAGVRFRRKVNEVQIRTDLTNQNQTNQNQTKSQRLISGLPIKVKGDEVFMDKNIITNKSNLISSYHCYILDITGDKGTFQLNLDYPEGIESMLRNYNQEITLLPFHIVKDEESRDITKIYPNWNIEVVKPGKIERVTIDYNDGWKITEKSILKVTYPKR
jgi:hypothetical protein